MMAGDAQGMPAQNQVLLAFDCVPEPNRVIRSDRDQAAAVGAEGQGVHETEMSFECRELGGRHRVPESDRLIPATGGQLMAIRAEGDSIDPVGVTLSARAFS